VIRNFDIPICPICNTVLLVRDSRKRQVKDSDGKSYTFSFRRLFCPICKKLHIEIPDFIFEYKQYSKNVIESIIVGKCRHCAADDSTIRRWKINHTPTLHLSP